MIFSDASAVIAILAGEPEADAFLTRLERDETRILSGVARWESIAGLVRSHGYTPDQAISLVDDFLRTFGVSLVPIEQQETEVAVFAYKTYGRGRHPASLNMGDCFAYACAKTHSATLLYKGDDFAKTDLA